MTSKTPDFRAIVALACSLLFVATPLAWGAGPAPVKPPSTNSLPGDGGDGDPPVSNPAYYEQNILSRSGETIQPLGPNLMGDTLNESSGGLGFSHTDVSIPGNNALPVAVGRVLAVGSRQAVAGLFGDWDIDIPHLHTVAFATKPDWYGGNGFGSFNQSRCNQFTIPPYNTYVVGNRTLDLQPQNWWDGHHMYIPGSGDQTLLTRAEGLPKPTDGGVYPIVTKQHWQLSCLSTLERGAGEGFMALSPDGTRYRFDHLIQRAYPSLDVRPGGMKPRIEIWILPTLVTDRFGNWVQYSYGGADGGQLSSITSSDGRSITLTYPGWGNRVGSVSDGTRTWSYSYDANGALLTVTQPDNSQWQFALSDLERDPFRTGGCGSNINLSWDYATHVGTITHPSGAIGTFAVKMAWRGRSNVPGDDIACEGPYQENGVSHVNLVPLFAVGYALTSKTLSGPGMPAMTWNYAYSNIQGCFAPCDGVNVVTITDPQGNTIQNTYGTQFAINEGLLRASSVSDSSGTLQTTSYGYLAPNAGPYPAAVGYNAGESDSMSRIWTPQSSKTITQQGVTFDQTSTAFDTYARSRAVTNSSSLGYSRAESTDLFDHTSLWVLGQVRSHTVAGVQVAATAFDEVTTALPTSFSRFGKLQASYSFNPDGTLASASDGLSHATTFGSYKRGLPQAIGYADGKNISAAINDIGTIASVTNEVGTPSTWNYGYDAMGRLQSATPPQGDPVTWNTKFYVFQSVNVSEYGLEPNHWRQTISEGNAVTVNYFDARWRKRLTVTYDSANPASTQRYQRFDYDPYNRTTFASYPVRSVSLISDTVPGTATTYDGLGRPKQMQADSELGPLTTSIGYLGSFQKSVTNPRGYATTTAYQAFGEPSEAAPVSIISPEGVTVTIVRDVFSKPSSITRSGSYGGATVSATRSYVYDGNHLLCKTVEPETGATIQSLDAANNLTWRASGLLLTGLGSCDTARVPESSKVAHVYDPRNRVTGTGFGDGSPSIGRTYTADGLPETVRSNNSASRFIYNNRRLLIQESHAYGSQYDIFWGYDANGHISQLTYPSTPAHPEGEVVAYSPNALGEATQVGGYASYVNYHPNGAVAGYTLGNGIIHSMTQNTRGLPFVNSDAGVLQDKYTYDANGNVGSIEDQQEGISSRTMSYDGLDRLWIANAPGVWGNGSYTYDPLDNVRTSTVGPRDAQHSYEPNTNRLTQISIPGQGRNIGYSYDVQGNIVSREGQAFSFDIGNRMTSASGVASYTYDGDGRRTSISSADGTYQSQLYSHAGQLLFATRRNGPSSWLDQYIYLGSKTIAETDTSAGTTYLHTDALGSPVASTNWAGTLINRTRYEPYGNTAAGAIPTELGFTGHVNEANTGLVYMQQRYYDPIAARFLSVDQVTTNPLTASHFSRYEYGENNPYKYFDPDGRAPFGALVKLLDNGGHRIIGYLSDKAEAVAARARGENVGVRTSQAAKQVEVAAHGGGDDLLKHTKQTLNDGSKGMPHYQTDGEAGHTFWSKEFGGALPEVLGELFTPLWLTPSSLAPGTLYGQGTAYPTKESYENANASSRSATQRDSTVEGGFEGVFNVDGRLGSNELDKYLEMRKKFCNQVKSCG